MKWFDIGLSVLPVTLKTQLQENDDMAHKTDFKKAKSLEDLAMTSSRLTNGSVTAEVTRLQPDNTWLWIIDQPAIAVEKRLIFNRQ